MKVFISADIEGCAGVSSRTQLYPTEREYEGARRQMTDEVLACCEGVLSAGATEVLVRDAHGTARNLQLRDFPRQVRLFSDWAGSPWSMMEGLDSTFHGTFFVGYHAPSGSSGNPLAHTYTSEIITRINGELCSEFHLNALASLAHGVPVCFLSGDAAMTTIAKEWDSKIGTVMAQTGLGSGVISEHPAQVCDRIREASAAALRKRPPLQCIPQMIELEFFFRKAKGAYTASFFPGTRKRDDNTIVFASESVEECLKAMYFISLIGYRL